MAYHLGIDFGTTYTAAAVRRPGKAEAEVVPLGTRAMSVASVVFVADDGSLVVGEAAERRALTNPDRVVREFKRRIGDGTPMVVGGAAMTAQELAARVVRWAVDRVAEREGQAASSVAVTHPAGWGPHKRELFAAALGAIGLGHATLMEEPQAAASGYASAQRVEPGSTVAVYDLGGGTFDAAVVRKTAEGGFELLGRPEGIEHLGGADFDEAVFEHVRTAVGGAWDGIDVADPGVLAALGRLRRECTEAKEALSADTEVTIPVMVPGAPAQVRLVRAEFEEMIRPAVEETVEVLRRAVASAGMAPADVSAVLLVGGSSRIPLVTELVSGQLGRPVAIDTDPNTIVALGAALAVGHDAAEEAWAHGADQDASAHGAAEDATAPIAVPLLAGPRPGEAAGVPDGLTEEGGYGRPARPAAEPEPLADDGDEKPARPRQRAAVLAATAVAVAATVLIMVAMFNPGGIFRDNSTVDAAAPGGPIAAGPSGSPGDATMDPWTGEPETTTTEPGPTREGARPAPSDVAEEGGANDTGDGGGDSSEPDPEVSGAGDDPSTEPTDDPSTDPTDDPSTEPTDDPSTEPTEEPTTGPPGTPTPGDGANTASGDGANTASGDGANTASGDGAVPAPDPAALA